ncbi:putative E3 ubiquitin-protein ligase UBR7 [Littorina saxatilis]|uniref:Putative E3 ubiquitin-protein ligase UBR7 n=1 Tax=Littorina saxatilis TaxID=31220 RepID=A0AAN9GFE4_9CAEN
MSTEENQAVDDGDSLSMVDVLAEQSRMQEDASAVLGDSDEQNCTYPSGYVQRQALYACSTCSPTEPAGICLACSYQCHEGHDLYELYTKRHFRCDCGNSKFGENKCKLASDKDDKNTENKYNQNFKGTYCICGRPYPDPEDQAEDEMIQCVMCEDWYHGRHLHAKLPDNENYQEMMCTACMDKHPFLWAYQVCGQAVVVKKESADDKAVKVEVGGGEGEEPVKTENQQPVKVESTSQTATVSEGSEPPAKRMKTEVGEGESGSACKVKKLCLLEDLQTREIPEKHCGAFWPEGWREKLCKCDQCLSMYKAEGLEFLLETGDSVHAYEERGRGKNPGLTDSEIEQSALSGMSHVQKIEVVQGFNDMKTELREYLKSFADSGKVVGPDDIKAFFADLEKKKRRRMGVPQFQCK